MESLQNLWMNLLIQLILLHCFTVVATENFNPCTPTDILQRYRDKRSAEVVVEEAFEDVQRDVGQTGVGVGIDGQDHCIPANHTTCNYIALKNKDKRAHFIWVSDMSSQSH